MIDTKLRHFSKKNFFEKFISFFNKFTVSMPKAHDEAGVVTLFHGDAHCVQT